MSERSNLNSSLPDALSMDKAIDGVAHCMSQRHDKERWRLTKCRYIWAQLLGISDTNELLNYEIR